MAAQCCLSTGNTKDPMVLQLFSSWCSQLLFEFSAVAYLFVLAIEWVGRGISLEFNVHFVKEHLFMGLLACHFSSSVRCLYNPLAFCKNCFLIFEFGEFLLYTTYKSLSEIGLQIFSPSL